MADTLTKQQVDNAQPLEFANGKPARAYPASSYTIDVCSPDGFTIHITLNDIKLEKMIDALGVLVNCGFTPLDTAPNPTPAATNAAQTNTPPTCQYHGPMKESDKRPGTWYCPKKMGDGSYCKEKYPAN